MPPIDGVAAIADHHHRFFAGHAIAERNVAGGPVHKRVPRFAVHEIAPGPRFECWTYATLGVWDAVHSPRGHGLEFVLTANEPSERLVELMAMIAYYHAGPPEHRLDVGHTVPIGEPWLPGSSCDHSLISEPYPFDPELEWCRWDGGHAQLLWVVPITRAERDYKAAHGLAALWELFEKAGMLPTDPLRPSVV